MKPTIRIRRRSLDITSILWMETSLMLSIFMTIKERILGQPQSPVGINKHLNSKVLASSGDFCYAFSMSRLKNHFVSHAGNNHSPYVLREKGVAALSTIIL